MGVLFKFECPSCGYLAEVSGGADRGFYAATQTIICKECKRLYDVAIAKIKGPDFAPEPGEREPLRCPESDLHQVERWSRPRPCPACGSRMEKQQATILWD
jgi:hypothetical protein